MIFQNSYGYKIYMLEDKCSLSENQESLKSMLRLYAFSDRRVPIKE